MIKKELLKVIEEYRRKEIRERMTAFYKRLRKGN